MPHPYPSPQLKLLFELSATLERFDDLGETPQGHRMLAVVGQGSGTISGDRVRGQMLQGSGGDWLLLRPDGAGQLDLRITIKTDDEALIYMRYEASSPATRCLGSLGAKRCPRPTTISARHHISRPARTSMPG